MREKTRVRRMFVLDGGSFSYDVGLMVHGKDLGKKQAVATPFYAFDTEEGWFLFDTGWPQEAAPVLEAMGWQPRIGPENAAPEQLKRIGVEASKVAGVVLSHLHVDHAGGLPFFPHARVYAQKDEMACARHPVTFQALAYQAQTFEVPGLSWNLLEGDTMILPGLAAVRAPGHTPGLQALVAELPESGCFVLCADAAYLVENLERDLPAGNAWNPVESFYSVRRLKMLGALLGAPCFPGHDLGFFEAGARFARPFC